MREAATLAALHLGACRFAGLHSLLASRHALRRTLQEVCRELYEFPLSCTSPHNFTNCLHLREDSGWRCTAV